MLNIYYEGQSAQIFGLPVFLTILLVLLYQRKNESLRISSLPPGQFLRENLRQVFFIAFLAAGLLSVYNELIFTLIVFLVFVGLLDIILIRRINLQSAILLAVSLALGFVMVSPLSYKWIHFIAAHLKNVAIAGWWQPKWAYPSEILGLFDIYLNNPKMGTNLLIRSIPDQLLNIMISELLVAVILVYITRAKDVDKAFWLAAPIFILLVFIKNHYIEQIHNYQYMKSYTIFLPLIFFLSFASLSFCTSAKSRFVSNTIRICGYAVLALILMQGLLYINKYNHERGYVTNDMLSLAACDKQINLNDYALITRPLTMDEYMLTPIIPLNWLNLNFAGNTPFMEPHREKEAALLVNKRNLKSNDIVSKKYADTIVCQNTSYLIIDTKRKVRECYDQKTKKYNIDLFTKQFEDLN